MQSLSFGTRQIDEKFINFLGRGTATRVVVRERDGTPFRQIFWSWNGAPANIVGHRWNANTAAFRQITSYSLGWPSISLFFGPNCPQTRDLASKITITATRRALGRMQARPLGLLGPRSRKPLHPWHSPSADLTPRRLRRLDSRVFGARPATPQCSSGVDAPGCLCWHCDHPKG